MIKKIAALLTAGIMAVSLCACGKERDPKYEEIMSGEKWKTSNGTLLDLKEDNTFRWYNSADDLTDNYYEGTYEVYIGQEAVDKLCSIEEYGITEESQKKTINEYTDNINYYYCVMLSNEKCMQAGEDTLEEKTSTPYYGFYSPDTENIELFSILSFYNYTFSKV